MIRLASFLQLWFSVSASNALLQHLPSYLGFSYLGAGVSLHGCSSKAQLLLLTLDEVYLLMAAPHHLMEIDGETVETVSDFILGGLQNHCRW